MSVKGRTRTILDSDSDLHTITIRCLEYLRGVAKEGLSEMIFKLKFERQEGATVGPGESHPKQRARLMQRPVC